MFILSPLLAIFVSIVFFRASPRSQPLNYRLLAASPGVTMAAFLAAAYSCLYLGWSNHALSGPYLFFSCVVPFGLIVASLIVFAGNKWLHALQLVNLDALPQTAVYGAMAIANDWP